MRLDAPHITRMNKTITALFLGLGFGLASPALAQELPPAPPQEDAEGETSMMEEGFNLLLRGLLQEMEPALDEMGRAMREIEPLARQLSTLLGDVRNYEAPERLPNGDILIRRKPDAPPPPVPEGEVIETPPEIEL
ncbi:MAG: AAA+ family ATPase [Pseudorhodobacter sp.]